MGQLSQIVAVVDDDAAVRHALKFALEFEGLTVRLRDSARVLLEDADLAGYGCLVIDFRMPDMDGLELVDALRARGVHTPVVMITGRATNGLRERAGRAGIHVLLEKPLSDGSLSEAIRSALAL